MIRNVYLKRDHSDSSDSSSDNSELLDHIHIEEKKEEGLDFLHGVEENEVKEVEEMKDGVKPRAFSLQNGEKLSNLLTSAKFRIKCRQ